MKGNSDEVVIETHEQSKTKETSGLKAYLVCAARITYN